MANAEEVVGNFRGDELEFSDRSQFVTHLNGGGILKSKVMFVLWAGVAVCVLISNANADEPKPDTILFSESFDDADLLKRGWYDGSKFKIVSNVAYAGKGCIEYSWKDKATKPHTSSGVRYSFKATDELFIRYYIKLSKDWDWSRRPYHPHFLTTENGKWHGRTRSHLTLYVEPVGGKLRLGATDMENENPATASRKALSEEGITANSTIRKTVSLKAASGTALKLSLSSTRSTRSTRSTW